MGGSIIFLALHGAGQGLDFTQLYPSFSSVSAKRTWILNDLFDTQRHALRGFPNSYFKWLKVTLGKAERPESVSKPRRANAL